ncbi:PH domain-containing protein [Oleiharenicola lentus]|uniref:PH domain-containing protein n=1 Tax=Oleiharenicola lentus TaxID=2508720 RepID=UPI003F67787B
MYTHSSSLLLRWLKVPPEPHAPFGAPESLRVFRAGKNFFKLKLLGWGVGQLVALAGVLFWAFLFLHVEDRVKAERVARAERANATAAAPANPGPAAGQSSTLTEPSPAESSAKPVKKKRARGQGYKGIVNVFVELAMRIPPKAWPLLWALKIVGFLIYLAQIPLTYSVIRLDYEMRWYVVTDRSLRIRTGVWSVQELTMSFANLQQVVVTQGPLQRLLKLADVRVQSAGGGADTHHGETADGMHTGLFHGVEHADEIRDLILARLKRFRETGLGDPDEVRTVHASDWLSNQHATTTAATTNVGASSEAIAAAQELAAEAKALRIALS